jgi:hypothetical protein
MKKRTDNLRMDSLEVVVEKAHGICNDMFLFKAVLMEEDEIRLFLDIHDITDEDISRIVIWILSKSMIGKQGLRLYNFCTYNLEIP